MTKQLEDLFASFTAMSPDEQIAKIRHIRHARTIERPAAAVRRVKKEKKKTEKTKDSAIKMLAKLSPGTRDALIAALQAKLAGEKK